MNIITRHCISNKFSLIKLEDNSSYSKKDLIARIDLWKYILKYKCDAKEQESILIGITTLSLDYFAICFASLELSMKIVIVDYNRKDEFTELEYRDPKTRILSPIDIFLHDVEDKHFLSEAVAVNKFKFFTNCSHRTYNINDLDFNIIDADQFQSASKILPNSSDIAIRCTSSGTTGTPKIIEHNHEFLYKISQRNASKFSGDCLHIRNLNHGSSIAVFLLPALMNDNVTNHLVFNVDEDRPFDAFIDVLEPYRESFKFINFPYPYMIDRFIDSSVRKSITWPNLQVQTLSYIQDSSKEAVRNRVFKSITSIFGSNETSGPVFECTITRDNLNQDSNYFTKVDNFYDIDLDHEGLISVELPVYNNKIITNDKFKMIDGFYVHNGRKDIVKINGEIIDYNVINQLNIRYENLYIVLDSVYNSLYIACWNQINEHSLIEVEKFFENRFERVRIGKVTILNKDKFLSGIKIDNELLREYFRTNV